MNVKICAIIGKVLAQDRQDSKGWEIIESRQLNEIVGLFDQILNKVSYKLKIYLKIYLSINIESIKLTIF